MLCAILITGLYWLYVLCRSVGVLYIIILFRPFSFLISRLKRLFTFKHLLRSDAYEVWFTIDLPLAIFMCSMITYLLTYFYYIVIFSIWWKYVNISVNMEHMTKPIATLVNASLHYCFFFVFLQSVSSVLQKHT